MRAGRIAILLLFCCLEFQHHWLVASPATIAGESDSEDIPFPDSEMPAPVDDETEAKTSGFGFKDLVFLSIHSDGVPPVCPFHAGGISYDDCSAPSIILTTHRLRI